MNKQERLIAEIHNEFDTAQDRLLTLAKRKTDNALIAITNRLKSIGFINTPVVKKGDESIQSQGLLDMIEYYSNTYPHIKFMTCDEFYRICGKYNLVSFCIKYYTRDVPEKNLREIEMAQKLKTEDEVSIKGLLIAAPESHFAKEINDGKEDPIVFRYVRGGIQVLTKWGLEANDPALVVPKLN